MPVDSNQRCTSPTVAPPDSIALSVAFADSQKGTDSGLPAASIARLRSGSATSATPDGTASSARATSRRVSSEAALPACTHTKSRSTPSEPTPEER